MKGSVVKNRRQTILQVVAALLLAIWMSPAGFAQAAKYRRSRNSVPGQFIVRLTDRTPEAVQGLARSIAAAYGGEIVHLYSYGLGGFAIRIDPQLGEVLADDPRVEYVEEDAVTQIDPDLLSGRHSTAGDLWFLDLLDGSMDGFYSYCATGKDVYAYVVDSGVDKDAKWSNAYGPYAAFYVGQVEHGKDFIEIPERADDPCRDQSTGWHGTAVAGVLAGGGVGVAPDTKIIPVRVVRCDGFAYVSTKLAGLEWVVTNDIATSKRPALVNISWWMVPQTHTNYKDSVEILTDAIIQRGIPVIASANNYPQDDACHYSPANLGRFGPGQYGLTKNSDPVWIPPRVITAGGTMVGDGKVGGITFGHYRWQDYKENNIPWTFENDNTASIDHGSTWGQCVSVWAPAKEMRVLHHQFYVHNASGTSFSAPQIAGVVARYLQNNKTASVEDVWNFIQQKATVLVSDVTPPPSQVLPVGGQKLVIWDEYCMTRPVSR